MENIFKKKNTENIEKKKEISTRLWFANEIAIKLFLGKINIEGKEYLKEIPENANIVIATTHLTDLDIPIVIHTLARDLNLAIMDMSTHHKFFGKDSDPSTNIALHLAGESSFIPIDYKKEQGESDHKSAKVFNPKNFELAADKMEEGKAIVISAHKPTLKARMDLNGIKGGYGAVFWLN